MANYNTTANIVLSVNGRQAQRMLATLEKDARRLERQLAKASVAGNKASMKKFQRELNATNKAMDQLRGKAFSVDSVLRRLDQATPKELNRALKQLQQELNGLQRGTAAWNAHVARIKAVKAELQQVNATLATQKSLWTRMTGWLNNAQVAIMGVVAGLGALVMAGRKAVMKYAEMEEAMANTRKYTRMTAEEVERLNDIFLQTDTRLSREQLNLLAQEAGRLGYHTVETVRDYVEAASVINVALVDLGEGATQTIAKISSIFGMEEMYGVRDAMLKVGSTVNVLSQNCTASKPYLVEFAQRLAGIGSTAKMTVPEILAIGATLDAHGQKVEMSATAIQRVIMALFKEPARIARKVGLETKSFIETLNRSTTDGVVMFLDALHRLGEDKALAILSPMFQDLGLDGVRVSSVLANLSSHLDFLKWQLGEASKAFREGTSASNEYAIFNNTVQASIEKAKNRVKELAIELGENLYPLMRHIYTSSSFFLRVLNVIVSFIVKFRSELVALGAGIVAYTVAMHASAIATRAAAAATALFNGVLKAMQGLAALAQVAFAALHNTVQYFTHGLEVNYAMQMRWRAAMSAMGASIAPVIATVTALALMIKSLYDRQHEYIRKLEEASRATTGFTTELAKEKRELDDMFIRLHSARDAIEQWKLAKDTVIKQYGKYLKGLVDEKGQVIELDKAYRRLAAAIRMAARERAIDEARKKAGEAFGGEMEGLVEQLASGLMTLGYNRVDATTLANNTYIELLEKGTLGPAQVNFFNNQDHSFRTMLKFVGRDHPIATVNKMLETASLYHQTLQGINNTEDAMNPLKFYSRQELKQLVDYLGDAMRNKTGAKLVTGINKQNPKVVDLTSDQVFDVWNEAQARLSAMDYEEPALVAGNPDFEYSDYTPYESDKDRRKREVEERKAEREARAAERRAAIKARKAFKDDMEGARKTWEDSDTQNMSDYSAGLKSWTEFLNAKFEAEMKYYEDAKAVFSKHELEDDEDLAKLMKKREDSIMKWNQRFAKLTVDEARRSQSSDETQARMDAATPGNALYGNEEALQQKLFEIKMKYLYQIRAVYKADTEEYYSYTVQIEQAEAAEQLRRRQLFAKRIGEWLKKYEYRQAGERMRLELDLLKEALDKQLITDEQYFQALAELKKKYATEYLPDSARPDENSSDRLEKKKLEELARIDSLEKQGVITHEQAEAAKERISRKYQKAQLDGVRQFGSEQTNQLLDIYEAWQAFFNATEEDGGNWATRLTSLAQAVFAVMNAGMQQYSEYAQACSDIELAKVEKKYAREIELAEGNSYRTRKLEKEKEKETARIKNEANRRAFAMKVIQAVAQTAVNALNAYGSAAQVPLIGYLLAPIAAGMALAAGAIQIATIKKQQQASEAQGYAEGGFTPAGRRDEPVGIVHAGEWVASQKLVNNPRTRPLLEALDYAQRNNTVGSIRMADVSRSISAPMMLAAQGAGSVPQVVVQPSAPAVVVEQNGEYADTMRRLADRLEQPFVTVNSVTGDLGMQRANDEYSRLMKNKSPKSRK